MRPWVRWRWFLATLLLIGTLLGGALYHCGDALANRVRDLYWRGRHADGQDPVCRDLATGRFALGSRLDDLVAAHPPTQRSRPPGRFTIVWYKPVFRPGQPPSGALVIARDGRLAEARIGHYRAMGEVTVFSDLTPADEAALLAEQMARATAWRADQADATGALAGGVAETLLEAARGTDP